MPLLRQEEARQMSQSAVVMDLADLQLEAQGWLASARAEATRMRAAAADESRSDAVRIREQARAAGHAEGFAAGREAGLIEGRQTAVTQAADMLKTLNDRWIAALEELNQHMPMHLAGAGDDLVRLALAIAEKITRLEGMRNRNVAKETVAALLRMAGHHRKVTVTLHPIDAEAAQEFLPRLLDVAGQNAAVDIRDDASLTPGGCVLLFGSGRIDAAIETQMARIAEELLVVSETPAGESDGCP